MISTQKTGIETGPGRGITLRLGTIASASLLTAFSREVGSSKDGRNRGMERQNNVMTEPLHESMHDATDFASMGK